MRKDKGKIIQRTITEKAEDLATSLGAMSTLVQWEGNSDRAKRLRQASGFLRSIKKYLP